MEIKEVLINRKNKLLRIIEEKLESSGVNNSEKVIAIRHGNTFQYYIKNDNSVNNGVYVRKNKIQKVRKIVQIEYDKKVKIHAEKEVKLIDKILSLYSDCVVEDVYERMPKGKQLLVVPVRKNDLEYILEWCNQEYEALPFRDNTPEYYSLKGERMRSKSEVIIANILYKKNIVYKYEKPLFLDGKGYVYPDFTLLDVKRRRELYYRTFRFIR